MRSLPPWIINVSIRQGLRLIYSRREADLGTRADARRQIVTTLSPKLTRIATGLLRGTVLAGLHPYMNNYFEKRKCGSQNYKSSASWWKSDHFKNAHFSQIQ
jgi:hypothetical protein